MLSYGQVLHGRYRIIKKIGKGGTSSVFLAEDISIGKKWAVKFLPGDDDTIWLAQNEINMMIRLDHQMFPRIVDAWQEREGYYIVSDYIEGVTLDRVLKEKQINRRMLIGWWDDIAEAIGYLHSLKPSILYLDLKLENIMLKKDGTLKLIDFGIAGRIADRGSLYGTPGYAAPEQYFNRGEMLDERTDIFAFGMLMYAMFTGRRPDKDLDRQDLIIRSDRRLPVRIRRIILHCISREKDGRYRNTDELLEALKTLKSRVDNAVRLKLAAAAAVIFMGLFGAAAVRYVVAEPRDDIAGEMIAEANEHIENGEYTREGIRIICGYIESGCLDEDICERFTYEVARNYFSVERNYREALRYFEKLDKEKWPEADYYIRLCRLQVSFEEDNEKYLECLKEFTDYNKGLGYGENRYKNDIMIANLYDGLTGSDAGLYDDEKAFLKAGLNDLRYAVEEGLFTDEDARYETEYLRRLCLLCEEAGDSEGTVKYGEEVLKLLGDNEVTVREDIEGRIRQVRE
ncbi:MAG: serine/threonine protein kinase [Lachnospiraceae bacterium]|nr:serine/threonine protein kinase [Lachnospiraceae bacterium]